MPGWIYDADERLIFEYREFPDTKNPVPITIAENVNPDAGPLIALAPRMEEFFRDMAGLPERVSSSDAMAVYSCSVSHAQRVIRELDAAKEAL
jgi:hypothetical protein